MAIHALNSRFARVLREAGGDGGTGGGGSTDPQGGDGGTGDGGGADWTPPTKEEWEAHQAKLKAANKEAADRRGELNKLKQQHETEAEKAAREAQEAASASVRPKLLALTGTVASAFGDARPERLGALLKLVNFDQVDLDNGSGLDAEVTRLKGEFPEFFRSDKDDTGSGGTPPARTEMGGRKPQGGQALSPMEQLVAQVQGRAQ